MLTLARERGDKWTVLDRRKRAALVERNACRALCPELVEKLLVEAGHLLRSIHAAHDSGHNGRKMSAIHCRA